MTRLLVSLALLIGFAAPVHAEGPMLVELFASKNCRAIGAIDDMMGLLLSSGWIS